MASSSDSMEAAEQSVTRSLQAIDVVLAELSVTAAGLRRATQAYGQAVRECSTHLQTWATFFSQIAPSTAATGNDGICDASRSAPAGLCHMEPPADLMRSPPPAAMPSTPDFTSPPITVRAHAPAADRFFSTTAHGDNILDLSVISSISAPADVADIGSPDDDSASFSQMGPRGTLADISALMNATRDEGGGSGAVDDLGADALICKRLSEQFLDGDKAGRGRRARDAPGKLDLGTLPSVYRTGVANTQITSVFDLLNASPESLTVQAMAAELGLSEGVLDLLLDVLQQRSYVTSCVADGVRKWSAS
ncbi:DASH complex subunit ASK1 [Plasmodiophora brassicae]